jgi:hypothetical protein
MRHSGREPGTGLGGGIGDWDNHAMEPEELIARWVLEDLGPEEVPGLAVDALEAGCGASSVAVLAGLDHPTRREVEAELPELLRHLGLIRPDRREALRIAGNACAHHMVDGSIAPLAGARRLSWIANEFWGTDTFEQLSIFVGLASEWDDHPQHRASGEADMMAAAVALLDRGGIRVEEGHGLKP